MTPDIILQRTGIDVRAVEQGDDAWHKLRLGVITASEVHNVIAKPRSGKKWPDMKMSYFHTLLAEVCTGAAPEVNAKALAWENSTRTTPEPSLSSLPALMLLNPQSSIATKVCAPPALPMVYAVTATALN